jgi:nucleoid-associated protein YgaU
VPVAPPAAARHEPRDPFAPLVNPAQPADGAPPADPGAGIVTTGTPPATTPAPAEALAPAPASPATTPATTSPAPAPAATITIKAGDTLGSLARQHGLSWKVLYEANRQVVGGNPNMVRPGIVLTLP